MREAPAEGKRFNTRPWRRGVQAVLLFGLVLALLDCTGRAAPIVGSVIELPSVSPHVNRSPKGRVAIGVRAAVTPNTDLSVGSQVRVTLTLANQESVAHTVHVTLTLAMEVTWVVLGQTTGLSVEQGACEGGPLPPGVDACSPFSFSAREHVLAAGVTETFVVHARINDIRCFGAGDLNATFGAGISTPSTLGPNFFSISAGIANDRSDYVQSRALNNRPPVAKMAEGCEYLADQARRIEENNQRNA